MSHDGIWRAACLITIRTTPFHVGNHEIARGVTDVGVGSGVLFGEAGNMDARFKLTLGSRGKLQETNAWERQTLNLTSGNYARRRVRIALPGSAATWDLDLT
jgi:hypothetical protein